GSEAFTIRIAAIADSNFEAIAADSSADHVDSTLIDDATPGTEPDADTALVSITGAQTIIEGHTSTAYTVSVDQAAGSVTTPITVTLSYSGIAQDGSDYTGVTTVTIPAGSNSASFTLATLDDVSAEGSEAFTIRIAAIVDSNFEAIAADSSADQVDNTIIDVVTSPIAVNDLATGITGQTVTIDVLGNDSEHDTAPSSVHIVGTAQPGDSLSVAGEGVWTVDTLTGAITFTPELGNTGDPTPVSYTVMDSSGLMSNVAIVSVDMDNLPVATADTNAAVEGGDTITGNVLDNEALLGDGPTTVTSADQNGIVISIGSSFTTLAGGKLTLNADGTYFYTPPIEGNVPTSGVTEIFNYYMVDVDGDLSSATLTIVVNNSNITPGSLIQLSNPNMIPALNLTINDDEDDWHVINQFHSDEVLPFDEIMMYASLQDYQLSLAGSLPNRVVLELEPFSFDIPSWAFRHTDPNEQLEFTATRVDGSPLPDWLHFNSKTLKFSGKPPKGATDERVMVTARDEYGNEVHTTFTVHVNTEDETNRSTPINDPENKPANENSTSPEATVEPAEITVQYEHGPNENHQATVGKFGFSEQIYVAGKLSKLQESRALLDSLRYL
ncbi:MAG: putative Ig domain-containing protein, partial [Methylovulum sp.]|nr:putative Ig domain-containing protein [Methylovulum sp.]